MDGSKKASARAIASARLSSRATCTTGPSPRPASRRTSVASKPSGAPPARITLGPGGVVGEACAIARLTYAPRPRSQGRSDQPSGPTVTLVYMPQNAVTKMNRTPMICTVTRCRRSVRAMFS